MNKNKFIISLLALSILASPFILVSKTSQSPLSTTENEPSESVNLANVIHLKVLETLEHADEIPGLKSEEFLPLKQNISQMWDALVKNEVIEISGPDKNMRPLFVTLQAVVEHVLANELQKNIKELKGVILTPMPATPLCTKGEISKELVDPSIETDPARLFTVKARTSIVRDFLFKGGNLYIAYPKGGLNKRTEEQQNIYQQELLNFPSNLFDTPLNCEAIPTDLIGATYLFQDQAGETYVFAIKATQAKDPEERTNFGLWFGSLRSPIILERVNAVFSNLE